MADKSRLTIIILIALVVILGAFVLYSFVIQPALQGYVVEKQNEGAYLAISSILTQIQQYGYVQIPLGQNQTLILVPYNPSQQPAQ